MAMLLGLCTLSPPDIKGVSINNGMENGEALTFTFKTLSEQAIQQGPTMITERWTFIILHHKTMRHVYVKAFLHFLNSEEKC